MSGDPAPRVSFVVPAHNEAALIGGTIDALHAAARAQPVPYEIVVVDDGSTDRTAEIASSCGARVVAVQVRQIAGARNAGARASAGTWLIFVDADTIVPAGTLAATLRALEAGVAGGGATVDFDGRLPVWVRVVLPVMQVAFRVTGLAAGCYVFCPRAVFDQIGGFDERLYAAEEVAFSRALRARGRVRILPERVVSSARKVRTFSTRELLGQVATFLRRGPRAVQSREHLALWYAERRDDPHAGARRDRRVDPDVDSHKA